MALNLVRNSRVFFTTNVAAGTGVVNIGTLLATNTGELQVLDGFSFSQTTNQDTISVSEAGSTPSRGTRAFNSSLAPVDFSFTTYIRPRISGTVQAEEAVLWNALLGANAIATATAVGGTVTAFTRATTTTGTATMVGTTFTTTSVQGTPITAGQIYTLGGITGTFASEWNKPFRVTSVTATTIIGDFLTAPATASGTGTGASITAAGATISASSWTTNAAVAADTLKPAAYALATPARSNVNQLQAFGLVVVVDQQAYIIDNCALTQAQIGFGLGDIAQIQWTGQATAIRAPVGTISLTDGGGNVTFAGTQGVAGIGVGKVTTANYITNKLSTASLVSNIGGISGTSYSVALTGGTITFNNNVSYITPANLGVVNIPIGYYTGNLAVSGNITAYMYTGTGITGTGALLNAILANVATAAETKYRLELDIGGSAAGTRVELEIDGCSISVPTVETQSIVSTTINFNAQGTIADQSTANAAYDLTQTNNFEVRYFSI